MLSCAADGVYKVVFLQRNNANEQQFRAYAEVAKRNVWTVHVVSPKTMKTSPHLPLICLYSVYDRSFRNDHPSFKVRFDSIRLYNRSTEVIRSVVELCRRAIFSEATLPASR